MSPVPQDPAAPTGRPTELAGVCVLDVGALVAHAAAVKVPALLAAEEPTWALLPLVEGARDPAAQSPRGGARVFGGLPVHTSRVVLEIDDEGPEQVVTPSVQDVDDGFRQRRWIVECYAAHWNAQAGRTDEMDPDLGDETLAYFRDRLSDVLRASAAESHLADPVALDWYAVSALAQLKAVEVWMDAGVAEAVDMAALQEAVKVDIYENRPFGIAEALAYDAASPASRSAGWGRVQRPEGHRVANFTTRDFFEWTADVTGYNERYVRAALADSGPIRQILEGERSTKGKKGSVFPEVLEALRERGASRLRDRPARSLWAQGALGTTADELAPAAQLIVPAHGKAPKRDIR